MAGNLSAILRKVLPVSNPLVDHYIGQSVWDQAILESLATFAQQKVSLPADVREMVQELADDDGISPKLRKRTRHYLALIPA